MISLSREEVMRISQIVISSGHSEKAPLRNNRKSQFATSSVRITGCNEGGRISISKSDPIDPTWARYISYSEHSDDQKRAEI